MKPDSENLVIDHKKPEKETSEPTSSEVEKALGSTMNTKVFQVDRLGKGSMNYVYKAETQDGSVIVRVFTKADFPQVDKLLWVDDKLTQVDINHAQILCSTRDSKIFPYGFMVEKFIGGKEGWQAMKDVDITLEEYYKRLGSLLQKIHSIKLTKEGPINKQSLIAEEDPNVPWFNEVIINLKNKSNLLEKQCEAIKYYVIDVMKQYGSRLNTVLCHADPGPQNNIYTPEGEVVLIDWDLAESSSPFRDLSPLTLNFDEADNFGSEDEFIKRVRTSVREGYGDTGFTLSEYEHIENVYNLISLAYLMPMHYSKTTKQDQRKLTLMKDRVTKILEL